MIELFLPYPQTINTNGTDFGLSGKIILHITPKPYVKVLPDTKKAFRIPDRCFYIPSEKRFKKKGEVVDVRLLGCELWNNTGFCKHTSSIHTRRKKKQVFAYNDYKKKLRELADEAGFSLLTSGWAIYFFIPMPITWSKKKRKFMHGQMKTTRPDKDNYIKAFNDALGKKRGEKFNPGEIVRPDDEIVAQTSGEGKFWVDQEQGYIEIFLNQPLYNPFNVIFL